MDSTKEEPCPLLHNLLYNCYTAIVIHAAGLYPSVEGLSLLLHRVNKTWNTQKAACSSKWMVLVGHVINTPMHQYILACEVLICSDVQTSRYIQPKLSQSLAAFLCMYGHSHLA